MTTWSKHNDFCCCTGGWHRKGSDRRNSTNGWESKTKTRTSEYSYHIIAAWFLKSSCFQNWKLHFFATVSTQWWKTMRICHTMTNAPGSWVTLTATRPRPFCGAREMEHSWSGTAAKLDVTPAVLCMYHFFCARLMLGLFFFYSIIGEFLCWLRTSFDILCNSLTKTRLWECVLKWEIVKGNDD